LTKAKGRPPRSAKWPSRLARKLLPAAWLSETESRRAGAIRRVLKKLGPTWLSSPNRRVIQGVCFAWFLWFFFYSCWPYRAQPAPVWKGWIPVEIDADSGDCRVAARDELPDSIHEGHRLHISDDSLGGHNGTYLGPFVIRGKTGNNELRLHPETPMPAEALEKMSISTGPWTLSVRAPGDWPSHYADEFAASDKIPVETFLLIDPLVSLSTAVAAKSWMVSLWGAVIILVVCVFIPRGFCGYICPLGTLIDWFDWAVAGRVKRFRVPDNGWWVHLKYYLLLGVMVAAMGGVLLSGIVSAIPVLTRGLLFLFAPLQLGFARGCHQVPPMNFGQIVSVVLFLAVLALGFLRPRFWCKYVCPSGAVFSLGNLFRVSERKVEDTCIHCNKCVEICPFDAIKPDFTTRVTDCTLCQTCGGVCPTHAIKFVERSNRVALKTENDPPTAEHSFAADLNWLFRLSPQSPIPNPQLNRSASRTGFWPKINSLVAGRRVPPHPGLLPQGEGTRHPATRLNWRVRFADTLKSILSLPWGEGRGEGDRDENKARIALPSWLERFGRTTLGRRSFVAGGLGLLSSLVGGASTAFLTKAFGARLDDSNRRRPVRPPGSMPEKEFLELCIRCGECFKVCPNSVLQPLGFQQGLEGLWTPYVAADWAGCEPSCNACGKACPTGAIRPLPLEEKKVARLGLAVVNEQTCLPWAGTEACQLCVDECAAAGYHAIEFIRVHSQADDSGKPVEGMGFLAPKVLPDKCVGCGLCQMRCYSINAKTKRLLPESAILVEAGEGKEDRLMSGSYRDLRKQQHPSWSETQSKADSREPQRYMPEFLERPPPYSNERSR
jgi:ferredoxin